MTYLEEQEEWTLHHICAQVYQACMKLFTTKRTVLVLALRSSGTVLLKGLLLSQVFLDRKSIIFLSPQMQIKLLVPPAYSTVIVKNLNSRLYTVRWWQCNGILYGTSRGHIIGVGFSFSPHFFPKVNYLTLTSGCIFFSLHFSIIHYLVWLQSLDFNCSDILIFKGRNDFIKIMSFR